MKKNIKALGLKELIFCRELSLSKELTLGREFNSFNFKLDLVVLRK